MSGIVDRNIQALLKRHKIEEEKRSLSERVADRITRFTGSMRFVVLHAIAYGLWLVINFGWIPGVPRFDPTFVILAMVASVEAIFLSTFVLITQNRMAALADRRSDLDLQMSLLSEHEITRLITLLKAVADRLDVEESRDPELNELAKDVRPEKVLDRIEENAKHLPD
ncbi:MAG TPA: DUF1003 domain-containing protein [Clostridia bacterium]|nr:DUF1003 domain-containing protein [Clostridia bacterium]